MLPVKVAKLKQLHNLLPLPIFFPFIGGLTSTDIQPTFFVLLVVIFPLIFFIKAPILKEIGMMVSVYISIIFISIGCIFNIGNIDLAFYFRLLMPPISFVLLGVMLQNNYLKVTTRFIIFIYLIYFSVGLVQYFYPSFLADVVYRSEQHVSLLVESGRGVRSLASEPTQLGFVFIFLNIIYFAVSKNDEVRLSRLNYASSRRCSCNRKYATLLFILGTLLISQSSTAIAVHFSVAAFAVWADSKHRLIVILTIALISFLTLVGFQSGAFDGDGRRVFNIIEIAINDPIQLTNFGAFQRILNIYLTLSAAVEHGYAGSGSSDVPVMVDITLGSQILVFWIADKVLGGIFEYVLQLGVFGIPYVLVWFFLLFKILIERKIAIQERVFYVFSLALTNFFYGSVVNPLPIFCLVYIYMFSTGCFSLKSCGRD